MKKLVVALGSVMLLFSGCRTIGAEGDHAPTLVSCQDYRPPSAGQRQTVRVSLQYRVTKDGAVDALSIEHIDRVTTSPIARDAAVTIAASCVYEPAIRNGYAVTELVRRTFTVDIGNSGPAVVR